MEDLGLLLILVGAYLLIGPGLGIAAFVQSRRQAKEMAALRWRLEAFESLRAELARLRRQIEPAPAEPAPAPPSAAREEPPVAGEEASAPSAQPEPPPEIRPAEAAPEVVEVAAAPPPAPATAGGLGGFEERLASRWMLWLGAVALALGGAFLVKYAIDEGWLGPATRVSMGFLFGLALAAAGEWLRQRPLARAVAALRPDYVPPALTASGLFIAFASVYAAFALYGLLSPLVAFSLLAALSAAAVFLSLLQGPFTALLGIIGGFATPFLVPSQHPSVWALFVYLLFLVGSALVVVRYTAALWVGQATLLGALLWPAFWLGAFWRPGDAAAVALYLLLLAALYLFVPSREPAPAEGQGPPPPQGLEAAALTGWVAVAGVAALLFVLVRVDSYGGGSLLALGAFVGLSFLAGRRLPAFEAMPLLAEALSLAAVAAWHLPRILTTTSPFYSYPAGYVAGPFVPPELHLFLTTTIAFAVLLGAGAFALMWGGRRPQLWAAASATTPVLLLLISYWRITAFGIDLRWSAAALALAGIDIAAAARVRRHGGGPAMDLALAIYAAAAVAALSLGAAMALQQAWLTVALALELPGLAWIGMRLKLDALRPVALAVAGVVLARLAFNTNVLDYPLGSVPGLNWMLYGYGVPSAAFLLAANWFRQSADDALVTVLELGALAFAVLLVTLELHNLVTGPLTEPRSGLLETSLQSIAWLSMAIGLAVGGRWSRRRAAVWARRVLAGLAVAQVILWHLLIDNPLWSGEAVGSAPVFNLLLLAYGVSAALIAIYLYVEMPDARLILAGGALALALAFVNLSLEVRRSFQGPLIALARPTSDGEWYCYSAAWLGFAGALLALGIWSRNRVLRYASLAVLLLAIGKVFLFDMAGLTGLYRVASFAGLGLSLIAIGYLYQRFVFPPVPLQGRSEAA